MVNNGELWIGSRSCRYQGLADVVLYGNLEDMTADHHVGVKYLWVADSGVLEMHGQERTSWTHLNDHLFKNSIPSEVLQFNQNKNQADDGGVFVGQRLGKIIFSR